MPTHADKPAAAESTHAASGQSGRRPRLPRLLLLLPAALAAVAGWWVATHLDPFSGPAPAAGFDRSRGELRYDPSEGGAQNDWQTLFSRPEDLAAVSLNPARQPLDHDPAGLPPYPGPEAAVHETRYRLADGPWVDDISFWRVNGPDPAALATAVGEHYRAAARQAGFCRFTPIHAAPAKPGRSNLLYFDDTGQFRSLSVQILEQATGCHVTITLRYEAPQS